MSYLDMEEHDFSELKGKTLVDIKVDFDKKNKYANHIVNFFTVDGSHYKLHHYADCCESVYLEDVIGDIQDLIGSPVELAEEVSNECSDNCNDSNHDYLHVWTFYKLRTMKGDVTFRFNGASNGYYSVNVSFVKVG